MAGIDKMGQSTALNYPHQNRIQAMPDALTIEQKEKVSIGYNEAAAVSSASKVKNIARESGVDVSMASKILLKKSEDVFKAHWVCAVDGEMTSKPLLDNGVLYAGCYKSSSNECRLYAIDAKNGKKLWEFDEAEMIESSPAASNGVVYFGSNDNKLYAVDTKSGKKLWDFQTDGPVYSTPVIVDGVVYFGSYDGTLYALDAQSGDKQWSYKTSGLVVCKPTIVDTTIYFGAQGREDEEQGTLYALDIKRKGLRGLLRRCLWKRKPERYAGNEVVVSNNQVYTINHLGSVTAFDSKTGKEKWTGGVHEGNFNSLFYPAPAMDNNVLYCAQHYGKVFALDKYGRNEWESRLPDSTNETPQVRDGIVYVSCSNKKLYALDTRDGKQIAEYSGDSFREPHFVVESDAIYIGGENKIKALVIPGKEKSSEIPLDEAINKNDNCTSTIEQVENWIVIDDVKLSICDRISNAAPS